MVSVRNAITTIQFRVSVLLLLLLVHLQQQRLGCTAYIGEDLLKFFQRHFPKKFRKFGPR